MADGADEERHASSEPLTSDWSEREILAEAEALVHLGAWAWDITSNTLWWSDETYRIFGLTPQEFPATYEAFIEHVAPDDRANVEQQVQAALADGVSYDVRHRVVRATGEVRDVHEHGRVDRDADGTPIRMLGTVRDITVEVQLQRERDEAVRALAISEQRYRLLAENAWDVVWTMAPDGTVTYVSPSVERVRGLTPAEAASQTIDQIHPPESAARVAAYYASLDAAIAAGTEVPRFHGEQEYYRKDGSIMLGELQVVPQVDAEGQLVQILGVTRDISERRAFEEQLSRLAVTDPLTGVWNRRHAEELLTADLQEARRYGPAMTLLMLDIDHFKDINDTFGHQVGDHVLVELCRLIRANLRSTDTLARWGGEEFIIAMRHCTLIDAIPLAEKIRGLIRDATFGDAGQVTVSIGAAELRHDDDLASWLERADQAMYQAKAHGRDSVFVRA